ncbi:MAG: bidirectional hydrogenase complex protein HoxE [Ardenticatenaceae bacterium]|nr:bidirectional hydrogenase complex protein HoxE [Ardenticatenaceae bacterium]
MIKQKQAAPPSDDVRWRFVMATMRRNGFRRSALIETLHTVQETFGFLDEESLRYVASSLNTPLSQVYGVSTFYHLFKLKPAGKHTCVVCTGTACYIKGSSNLLKQVEKDYDIKPGETTPDNQISLLTARCVGACGVAPVAIYDGTIQGELTADKAVALLERYQDD